MNTEIPASSANEEIAYYEKNFGNPNIQELLQFKIQLQ